jgi:hypothetical protein
MGFRDMGCYSGNQADRGDLVVETVELDQEEEIEEIFSQLWSVSKPEKARVTERKGNGGVLIWIHNDLVRERRLEDCFPVGKFQKLEATPTRLSFSRHTYADVLKRIPMVQGGRWVWQPDKAQHAPGRGGFRQPRGGGGGFRPNQQGGPQQNQADPSAMH